MQNKKHVFLNMQNKKHEFLNMQNKKHVFLNMLNKKQIISTPYTHIVLCTVHVICHTMCSCDHVSHLQMVLDIGQFFETIQTF